MTKVQRVGEELRKAMKAAQALGYVIKRRVTFGPSTRTCCALGAYAVVNGLDKRSIFSACRESLGLSGEDIDEIVCGFDSEPEDVTPYYQLGRDLAAEFVKE